MNLTALNRHVTRVGDVFRRTSYRGVRIDMDKFSQMEPILEERIDEAREQFIQSARERGATVDDDVNLDSPKQMPEILSGQLKIPLGKTEKGNASTSQKALENIALSGDPLIISLLRYRSLCGTRKKLYRTKGKNAGGELRNFIDGEYVHLNYRVNGTVTGRPITAEPNIQNFSDHEKPWNKDSIRIAKSLIIAHPGDVLVGYDLSQAEYRLYGSLSHEPELIKGYEQGLDYHSMCAINLLKADPDAPDFKEKRAIAKNVNFAKTYGASAKKVSTMTGLKVSQIKRMLRQEEVWLKRATLWKHNQVRFVKNSGYVANPFGRIYRFQGFKSSESSIIEAVCRYAVNYPIQGGIGDYMNICLSQTDDLAERVGAKFLLHVYDSLLWSVPKDVALEFLEQAANIGENPDLSEFKVEFDIPMVADKSMSETNWAELKEVV